jgi:hypothetical protein
MAILLLEVQGRQWQSPLVDFFETRPIEQTEWKGGWAPVTVVSIFITAD